MVIQPKDRVADVLAQDQRMIEVFATSSPLFTRLRNPTLRRVMARLITVEQAAQVANLDLGLLLDRLNETLRSESSSSESIPQKPKGERMTPEDARTAMPRSSDPLPPELIVELDVREELRAGQEPFSQIMQAFSALPAGGGLRLRAIFEPVPLYQVLGKRGYSYRTEQLGPEDWSVLFYRAAGGTKRDGDANSGQSIGAATADRSQGEPVSPGPTPLAEVDPQDPEITILDVRGLEPPEPLVRTMLALEELPRGATLMQLNVRVPVHLIARLEERGFEYTIREQNPELVRIFIRHAAQSDAVPKPDPEPDTLG